MLELLQERNILLGQIKLFQAPILEIWVRALEPQCTKLCRKGSVIWHLLWRNLCWSSHQKIFPKREWENGGFISLQGFPFPAPQILNFSEYWEEWCATGRVVNVADITDMSSCQFKETASLGYHWGETIVALIWDVPAFRISTKRSPMQIVHETIFIFDVPCGQPKSSNFCEENTSKSHLNCIYREEVAPSSGAFLDKI